MQPLATKTGSSFTERDSEAEFEKRKKKEKKRKKSGGRREKERKADEWILNKHIFLEKTILALHCWESYSKPCCIFFFKGEDLIVCLDLMIYWLLTAFFPSPKDSSKNGLIIFSFSLPPACLQRHQRFSLPLPPHPLFF